MCRMTGWHSFDEENDHLLRSNDELPYRELHIECGEILGKVHVTCTYNPLPLNAINNAIAF